MFGLGLGGRYTPEDVTTQGSVGVSGVGQNAIPKFSGREANHAQAIQCTTLSHWGKHTFVDVLRRRGQLCASKRAGDRFVGYPNSYAVNS